ncbi:MAG: 1-acyl-sn-glycerol-3-phosphate acyltransferase [Chloroflexi bacterium]|nr:1-acyl-sn-glycerol-3-phosphate acyltransferase [Chloroflexota bacterium]
MSASVVEAFCFTRPALNAILHILCAPFILELTRLGIKMEAMIARDGHLRGASKWLVDIAARAIHIQGAENVPTTGPVLFLGNHAGLGDAFALLAASPRRDTQVLAYNFGILPGLQEMRRHVIVVDKRAPYSAMRESLRHLRGGNSLLLFPRGEIEDDPALALEPALASLAEWSRSFEFFARHVPDLTILPCAVGGVISRRALLNPVVRCYRDKDRRHFLAATFQMMFPFYRDPVISLHFGRPLRGETATHETVLRAMAQLLRRAHDEGRRLLS